MRKHPYISVVLVAVTLALVAWWAVPKQYAATTKLRDEYKETDLALGLNQMSVMVRDVLNPSNTGMNDVAVYCQILTTRDFLQKIAAKPLPDRPLTYGEWIMHGRHFWQSRDTLELINRCLEYNYSNRAETLTIQLVDRDPVVAAQMLDSVTTELQRVVTESRHSNAQNEQNNLAQEREKAAADYYRAQNNYAAFCDSHVNVSRETELQELARLQNELTLAEDYYGKVSEQYARQLALLERDYNSFAVIQSNTTPVTNTSRLWLYLLVIVSVALVCTKAVFLYKERRKDGDRLEWGGVFSPWSITLLVWGGMGLMIALFGDTLDPLTDQFYRAIALWLPILVLTSFATFNLLPHATRPLPQDGIEINKSLFYLFFALAVVLSPMYMYQVWQIVSSFGDKDMLKNVRDLAVHGSGQGILNYAIVISQSLLLVSLWRYPKMPLWQVIVIILCCLLNSLAIMEKGSIFLVILCGLYVLFERRVIRLRTIVLVGLLTVVVFYLFNLAREGTDSDYSKNESLMDFLGMYVLSPPVAFCRVRPEISDQFGTNTLETIYLFLNRFGANVEVHAKTQEFVFVPVSTNVYTIMQPFFRDFDYAGVAFFAWLYGIVSGVLYRYSCNGNALCICLYTYMVNVLILQFYQENLFLSMVFVLQLVFFLFLFTQQRIKLTFWRRAS